MAKNPKRPRDPNQLAKTILDIVTGEKQNEKPANTNPGQRLGGLKGGKSRANKLTKEERIEIAKNAAKRRWQK